MEGETRACGVTHTEEIERTGRAAHTEEIERIGGAARAKRGERADGGMRLHGGTMGPNGGARTGGGREEAKKRLTGGRYEDILYLPHPVSAAHPPMPAEERAAQFSPFAALTGYEDAIEETERMTQERLELTEDEKAALDEKLRALLADAGRCPQVEITLFLPDTRKAGGAYATYTGSIKKVDMTERLIHLEDGRTVPMDEIVEIEALP